MRHLRNLLRSLSSLKILGFCGTAAEEAAGKAAAQAFLDAGLPSASRVIGSGAASVAAERSASIGVAAQQRYLAEAAIARQEQQQQKQRLVATAAVLPFVMDAHSLATLQLHSLVGLAPLVEPGPGFGGGEEPLEWRADSVMRKRRRKMNKHKHKRRLKRDRRKSR